jgi:hypothetical protein
MPRCTIVVFISISTHLNTPDDVSAYLHKLRKIHPDVSLSEFLEAMPNLPLNAQVAEFLQKNFSKAWNKYLA